MRPDERVCISSLKKGAGKGKVGGRSSRTLSKEEGREKKNQKKKEKLGRAVRGNLEE